MVNGVRVEIHFVTFWEDLSILGRSEKHCGVKVICFCIDTIHISLAPAGSLGWMRRSCTGAWEWGVGGWRVCGGHLEFGFSSQRNVSGFEVSQLPTLLMSWFWEVGRQAYKMLPGTGVFSSSRSLPFMLLLWRDLWMAACSSLLSLSFLFDWREGSSLRRKAGSSKS